ncbi:MAG: hypothetical protein WBE75_00640 [Candidatus Omnitrophota bacterium]|jgi:tetratricopeptide (TPR) repeat protein
MRIKGWVALEYSRYSLAKAAYFLLLAIGVLMPYKMRIRYAEFLTLYGQVIKEKVLYLPYSAHLQRAERYYKRDRFRLALGELRKAQQFDEQGGEINILIARCYAKLGKKDAYVAEIIKGVGKNIQAGLNSGRE